MCVIIYCDGGCVNNKGPRKGFGGWGAYLMYLEHRKKLKGSEVNTTSNRMELTAAIKALRALKRKDLQVKLHSDSQYLIKGITIWSKQWVKNNWIGSAGTPVINKDLWLQLLALDKEYRIEWIWVRGHTGDLYQETVHTLAELGINKAIKNAKL